MREKTMERIDEILGRIGGASSKGSTTTSSSADRVSQLSDCPRCGGLGFVRRDVPVGHPDFGRAIPCECKAVEVAERTRDDLRRAGNLDLLAHMTFDRFIPDGRGLSPDKQRNLRVAYDVARGYAAEPRGWLLLKGGY